MTRVGVVGATGYAGAELVRILSRHPEIELCAITSSRYANIPFAEVYPSLAGIVDLVCEKYSVEAICEKTDILFTALPHKFSMEIVPELLRKGKRVIDLSADFRLKNVKTYEAFYQLHSAKEWIAKAVYGLCEVNADQIKDAALIGSPGCYPTGVLLPLVPLIKDTFLNIGSIIADSKSGVSGAGRSLSLSSHFCEVNESFKAYKVGVHRHTPEMEETLSMVAGEQVTITFVPHLVPMTRGILTTIYASLAKKANTDDIQNCISSYYQDRTFIRIGNENVLPDTLNVRGTNYCDIGFKLDERNNRLVLLSAIDNLVKGAAGQAVQSMNIMLGFDETKGLNFLPYPL